MSGMLALCALSCSTRVENLIVLKTFFKEGTCYNMVNLRSGVLIVVRVVFK